MSFFADFLGLLDQVEKEFDIWKHIHISPRVLEYHGILEKTSRELESSVRLGS